MGGSRHSWMASTPPLGTWHSAPGSAGPGGLAWTEVDRDACQRGLGRRAQRPPFDGLCPPLRGAGHCDSSGGVFPRLQRPHMTNVSPGIRVQPLPNLLRLVPHLTLPRELWPGCLPALGASETHAMTESSTLHARPGSQALGLPPPRRPGSRPSPGVHGPSAPRAPAGVSGGRPPR